MGFLCAVCVGVSVSMSVVVIVTFGDVFVIHRARVKLLGPLNLLSHIYHLYRIVVWRNHKVGPDQEPPPEPDERVGKLVAKALAR
jgi:hypothetical protein